ncbi:MAG TPA: FKBP-type peptidyl-prolyl cis-trans isomerase [Longimicrobiaceae bacterium]|nr:FKBP-type peptidyl-prolyl cis-trans isomerase [Longimicrobiaceae bacterium]
MTDVSFQIGLVRVMAAVVVPLLFGCAEEGAQTGGQTAGPPEAVTYAPELEVDLGAMQRSGSGLYQQDLSVGSGEVATPLTIATVHYTGWLPDGSEFDSSRGGQPFQFQLGAGEVIPGWDEGVAGMREGGVRRLVIPSQLAYGDRGAGGVIPPGATLVFQVELLDVQ